jgi:hypothetical protein
MIIESKSRATSGVRRKPKSGKIKRAAAPPYLATELGQPADHEGEVVGAGAPLARSGADLQAYVLQLWRQTQTGRVVPGHLREMESAGFTIDDIWAAGVTEILSTSSTPDEIRRYRQKVLFRANLLEALLWETIAELRHLDSVESAPAEPP